MGVFSKGSNMISETNITVISSNTEFKGDITTEGIIQIEGKCEGKITSRNSVIVGLAGTVTGEIIAEEIVVNGRVNGTVEADRVRIGEKGILKATVISEIFAISEGGSFEGEKKFKLKRSEEEYIEADTELV
ncbi:MAG: polymer-forming cytoskeletal protein [Sebaldella sp.]|nr:polymer-forming cytoskeletal protein [Sebaldella sp.]